MGYNQRNDEIRDKRREREAYADALATVEQFNARLAAQEVCVVLADDCSSADIETSLVDHRLRRLRHGD